MGGTSHIKHHTLFAGLVAIRVVVGGLCVYGGWKEGVRWGGGTVGGRGSYGVWDQHSVVEAKGCQRQMLHTVATWKVANGHRGWDLRGPPFFRK